MNKGFTIIELIMVIVIAGVLTAGTAPYINAVIERWQFLQFRNEAGTQARNALDWMVREIREVKDNNSFDIADSSRLKFTNSSDISIDYTLSGNTLMRNSDALVSGVNSLQFEYRNVQNNIMSSLPLSSGQRKQIWRIRVILTLSSGGETLTLETDIFPRNLGS
ncbi:MAG: type II secretion system GspH family protein [Candidatus Omnitrophica bacterium]|nr:type II secretion system GspH family protein [Candidatus Omnitrophota bacterium]MBU1933098.1 type II secretion system GspH family protein [Candidatus Omnitrophota bacterium]